LVAVKLRLELTITVDDTLAPDLQILGWIRTLLETEREDIPPINVRSLHQLGPREYAPRRGVWG
jgi:hypothetical protein